MSGHIRIRACTSSDVQVYVVDHDGKETLMTGIKSVVLEAKKGGGPLFAKLECYVEEVDFAKGPVLDLRRLHFVGQPTR